MINWMFSQKKKIISFSQSHVLKVIEWKNEQKTDAKPDETNSNKFDAIKQHRIEKLIK